MSVTDRHEKTYWATKCFLHTHTHKPLTRLCMFPLHLSTKPMWSTNQYLCRITISTNLNQTQSNVAPQCRLMFAYHEKVLHSFQYQHSSVGNCLNCEHALFVCLNTQTHTHTHMRKYNRQFNDNIKLKCACICVNVCWRTTELHANSAFTAWPTGLAYACPV